MSPVPLHPALVHLPLGLAFILPFLAVGFTWAIWTRRIRPHAWFTIVALLAVLLVAGLVALNTGQREEDRVEKTVPEAAIAQHEAYAEQFLWAVGVTLFIAGLALVLRQPLPVRSLTVATALGTFLIAGAALRVGHAGGQLVYVHNAAAAYAAGNGADAKVVNQKGISSGGQAPASRDNDDR